MNQNSWNYHDYGDELDDYVRCGYLTGEIDAGCELSRC